MGDPRLFTVSDVVTQEELKSLDGLIQDMLDTMVAANGAGLAAPQIGVMKRVVVYGIDVNPRYPDAEPIPLTVLVNPKIEPLSDEFEYDWEGCLSVPGIRGLVPRCGRIRYSALNPLGEKIGGKVDGFHARVIQHECDHLDGVLYPMRIEDLRDFGFEQELMVQSLANSQEYQEFQELQEFKEISVE